MIMVETFLVMIATLVMVLFVQGRYFARENRHMRPDRAEAVPSTYVSGDRARSRRGAGS